MFSLNFEWFVPTKIVCKENAIDETGLLTRTYGKKAMLIADRNIDKNSSGRGGYIDRVDISLRNEGIDIDIEEDIPPEPKVKDLIGVVNYARNRKYDFIIALGGGSTIDAAKAIAVAVTHPGDIVDYLRSKKYGNKITERTLPIVAIPSTSGSGSETSCYSVLENDEEVIKDAISSPYIYPKLCIIDPYISSKAPNSVKLSAGLDVLAHALESYISKISFPIIASMNIEAVSLVFKYLPRVLADRDDIEAHTQMAVASAMAGITIALGATVVGHATAHAWGAASHITHGLAVAALLPWVIEINKEAARDKLAYIADKLNLTDKSMSNEEKVNAFLSELNEFYSRVGFNVKEVGKYAKDISIEKTAEIAMKQSVILQNPYPVTQKDIEKILEKFSTL